MDSSNDSNESQQQQQQMIIESSSRVHLMYSQYEDVISIDQVSTWMRSQSSIPCAAVIVYLMLVFFGQQVIQKLRRRSKRTTTRNLRSWLIWWNCCLTIFSIIGSIRIGSSIWYHLNQMTLMQTLCYNQVDNVTAFWGLLFAISKFIEFGDTLFLILLGKKVILLHWYHHVTVSLYTWFTLSHQSPLGHFFSLANLIVHSFMYGYFAAQTIGFKIPKFVSMSVTILQISQMMFGMVMLYLSHVAAATVGTTFSCATPNHIWISGLLMYASYFVLFTRFFVQNYFSKLDMKQRIRGDEVININDEENPRKYSDANSRHVKIE